MRAILLLFIAACGADAVDDMTSDEVQADSTTWSTLLNEPRADFNAVAVSPKTHTIVVAGLVDGFPDTQLGIWRRALGTGAFGQRTITASHSGAAVAVDSTGVFYLVGSSPAGLAMYKSTNDGASWSTVTGFSALRSKDAWTGASIVIDGSDRLYVAAAVMGPYGEPNDAILRSDDHAATWHTAYQIGYPTFGQVGISGLCLGNYNLHQAVYASADVWPTTGGESRVVALVSVDSGISWTLLETRSTPLTEGNWSGGCAGHASPPSEVLFATTLAVGGQWDARNVVFGSSRTDNVLSNPSATFGAVFTGNRRYVYGTSQSSQSGPAFHNWRVRFSDDGSTWSDGENWHYAGTVAGGVGGAEAHGATFDAVSGLFIVGFAIDATGLRHAILRHLDQ